MSRTERAFILPDMLPHVSDVDSREALAATLPPSHTDEAMKALTYSNETVKIKISIFMFLFLKNPNSLFYIDAI